MKTIFTYLFLLAFTFGSQKLVAQTLNEVNNSSLQKAKALQARLKLNDSTFKKVHQAYVEYDGKIASLKSLAIRKSGKEFGNKKHLLKIRLQKTIKAILAGNGSGDDDFDKYLSDTRQQNFTNKIEKPEYSKTVNLIDKNPNAHRTTRRIPSRTVNLKRERHN